jgi:diaminohydroxyphosphoribosylaminopyrimidine deaminase/5-amino-6-(5-phosphoribosylamino)uracil reductase
MRLALVEAARAIREGCAPYPGVGVILEYQGLPIIRAHNGQPGQPHAEVRALDEAQTKNLDLSKCILHTNLEPCCNGIGLVHACTKRILEAKVQEVHIALEDPYHLVRGQGIAELRAAGVKLVLGELADEARFQNRGYINRFCPRCGWEIDVGGQHA